MDHTLIQKLNDLARHFAIEHKAREFNPDSAVKNYDIEEAEKKDSGSDCLG
jgi:hypothetical protein